MDLFKMMLVLIWTTHTNLCFGLSIWSYNIMDSGFRSESGVWDPKGDRIPGNLTDFMAGSSKYVDILGIVETAGWTKNDTTKHPGYDSIAKSWGFAYVHVRDNCAIMSKKNITVLEEPPEGSSTIVAKVDGVVYIVTSMSSLSSASKYEDFKRLATLVMKYTHEKTVLMGDLNALSPLDAPRYNESLLCGNGTYDPNRHTGEYVINFCLQDADGNWKLDYSPMETLMNSSDLTDLCYVTGGFYDSDPDVRKSHYSSCAFSNPTLLIRMTGEKPGAQTDYKHAQAKIDYILANENMLSGDLKFHHTTVVRTFQADGCSDHYPIEATFL